MAKDPYKPRTPLIGMVMVFLALGPVGVTAYFHEPLGLVVSIIGYVVAFAVAGVGCWFVFKDVPQPPHREPGTTTPTPDPHDPPTEP